LRSTRARFEASSHPPLRGQFSTKLVMMRLFTSLRKGQIGLLALGATAAALAVEQARVLVREAHASATSTLNRPVEIRADGFESSGACRACHPSQHASWRASYHRTMTQVATPQTVAASFDGVRVDETPGGPMR